MDKTLRNQLRNTVTAARKLLEGAISERLEGQFGIFQSGKVEDAAQLGHLSAEDQGYRQQLVIHLEHIRAGGLKPKDAAEQLIREVAFTHLNRLCAYKLMEARGLIRESVSRGVKSQGFLFYLADHPDDEALANAGEAEKAYRHFLRWLSGTLGEELGALFAPDDPADRLYPPLRVLDQVLELLNAEELNAIWTEDETIGWVYQYFTPKELREQARKESSAPRNSYELAFRNQFYTPRYVVEFLTDNTLGRTWYEMRQGKTGLTESCRYLVRRPVEIFLKPVEDLPFEPGGEGIRAAWQGDFSRLPEKPTWQEWYTLALMINGYELAEHLHMGALPDLVNDRWLPEFLQVGSLPERAIDLWMFLFFLQRCDDRSTGGLDEPTKNAVQAVYSALRQVLQTGGEGDLCFPVFISHRDLKDPRDLKILDPACGSGHFLLYCFDLLMKIYVEAWQDCPQVFTDLRGDLSEADFLRRVPGMILRHNLHGIDIDLRATQIASLALWLRAQRAYQEMELRREERPKITRANIVCAEPMPGEPELLEEFCRELQPPLIGQLVKVIFEKMKLAGEAGSLLKIEQELEEAIQAAKAQMDAQPQAEQLTFWPSAPRPKQLTFDLRGITKSDVEFWQTVEKRVLNALKEYASQAVNGLGYKRKLFADDAIQGFAFIDLFRKRYDVVLMNPPFGLPTPLVEVVNKVSYPETWEDIYASFFSRSISLTSKGRIGTISPKSYYHAKGFRGLRNILRQDDHCLEFTIDIGGGVLDAAVEVCLSIVAIDIYPKLPTTIFVNLTSIDREIISERILGNIKSVNSGIVTSAIITVNLLRYLNLPNSMFPYRIPPDLAKLFDDENFFEPEFGNSVVGITTFDNERFIRLRWEIRDNDLVNHTWIPIAMGGGWDSFFSEFDLVVNWQDDAREMRNFEYEKYRTTARTMQSKDFWFKPGLTFSKISSLGFSAQPLPTCSIVSSVGFGIFPKGKSFWSWLGYFNSAPICQLISLFSFDRHWHSNSVASLPVPKVFPEAELSMLAKELYLITSKIGLQNETAQNFVSPEIKITDDDIFNYERTYKELSALVISSLGLSQSSVDFLNQNSIYHKRVFTENESELYERRISYLIGCLLGRWDIRVNFNVHKQINLFTLDPFLSFPDLSFGRLFHAKGLAAEKDRISSKEWLDNRPNAITLPEMVGDQVVGKDGQLHPATIPDEQYPIRIVWEGILVDDPDHPDDIVTRSHDVLEALFPGRGEAVEQEACQALDVKSLRDYFRKPSAGGFWMDHVKRYSKSRRKAPIYWLLQSSRRNYALWLYYHRLDKDLLFKALTQYVEPKIRLEEEQLKSLRAQRGQFGTGGRQAKELDQAMERQADLLLELEDFRDKLRRAADLGLDPDLNDGVVLNIAPLWELVPWNEAKKYWQELLEGKYEWSSIGKQLRGKGMVK